MYEYAAHRAPPLHTPHTAHNTSRLGRFFSPLLPSSLLSPTYPTRSAQAWASSLVSTFALA